MGRYPDLGPGVTGVHNKGPVVSEYGFRVGDKDDNTEVIDKDGLYNPELMAMSLAGNDEMVGDTIDATTQATHTVFTSSGTDQYDVTIVVRVTTEIDDASDIKFGDADEDDKFGTLSVTDVDETEIFAGRSGEGHDVQIDVSGTASQGEFTYICIANKV